MAGAVKKGWILTGVYCAAALMPGVNAMLGFFLAWGLIMAVMPAMWLTQLILSPLGATPDWMAAVVAGLLAFCLVPLPTFVNAWLKSSPDKRVTAVLQILAMWLLAAGATLIAFRALEQAWP